MSSHKFQGDVLVKNNLQVDNGLTLSAETASRALILDGSGNVVSSSVTSTELGHLSGVTSNLQTQLDAKLDDFSSTTDNALLRTDGTSGEAIQDSGITIDDSNNMSGVNNLTISGNLEVNGTTTTVNSATLDVEDANITVNNGGTDGSSEGAGLTVDRTGTSGSLIYADAAASKFKIGALASEVEVADISTAQTFTNKTIVAANNTITTAASGNLTSTELNAALAELQSDIDTRQTDVITTQGDIVIGDGTGEESRLAIGTNGQVLQSDGTTASWQDLPAGSDEQVKVSANDTTAKYLEDAIVVSAGVNTTNSLELSTLNDAGDEDLQIQFDESKVDHDALLNFVANEHIDHSSVTLTAGDGLSGGGNITTSRSFAVDINGSVDLAAPAVDDELLISDISNANAIRKADVASIVNLADHDALTNFVANEHIDHSGVNISAGEGLTGGGDITASRTLDLDISDISTSETSIADADLVAIHDDSAGAIRKMTRANFVAGLAESSPGDIPETSFSGSNNVSVASDVTGLAFANGTVRSFKAQVSVFIDADTDLYEVFELIGIQKGASWDMAVSSTGDESNITFSITSAGQVQYTSGNETGFVSSTFKFRAETTSV